MIEIQVTRAATAAPIVTVRGLGVAAALTVAVFCSLATAALGVYALFGWWPGSGVAAVVAATGCWGLLVATAEDDPDFAGPSI